MGEMRLSWTALVREAGGVVAAWLRERESGGAVAPGTAAPGGDESLWMEGHPCRRCGRRFTTERAMGLHVGPDGECLDPMTARRPRGGFILSIVRDGPGGEPLWGWPGKVLDARACDE
jgi:hypothetical protein